MDELGVRDLGEAVEEWGEKERLRYQKQEVGREKSQLTKCGPFLLYFLGVV